jgi:transposase
MSHQAEPVTGSALRGFFADPSRFANSRQAAAFSGPDPRHPESGTSVKVKLRLSQVGHALLRQALYLPAMVTWYKTAWSRRFKERLALSGKPAKLIIAAMLRKLLPVAFRVLKSGKNFDPALHGA